MHEVLRFHPIYKEKIWGGRKLESILGRAIPSGKIGESWEISDYKNEVSIISNREWNGKSFREIYTSYTDRILGSAFVGKEFPLLVKIIDADDWLSVQVHPDNYYAMHFDPENSGKKEAWFVLESDPGAEISCGFKEALTREKYQNLIELNRAEEPLQSFQTRSKDAFLIEPGTVHAIGKGNLILEVQQSSDSTYRVYDYGRKDDKGNPRELHLKKALDVLNFNPSNGNEKLKPQLVDSFSSGTRKRLTANDKFILEILEWNGKIHLPKFYKDDRIFRIIHVLAGDFEINGEFFKKGDSFLVTAMGIENQIEFRSSKNSEIAIMGPGNDFSIYI